MYLCAIFFFFKQKTAYEMRISDWSSDVCSSDLKKIAMNRGGKIDRNLHRLVIADRPQTQLAHCAPPCGSKTRSRVTITRSVKPGRTVNVGGTDNCRSTSCRPVWLAVSCVP